MKMNLDVVTHVCPCGSQMWRPKWVIFHDYEIAGYAEDMECILCGTTAKCPTELDRPE